MNKKTVFIKDLKENQKLEQEPFVLKEASLSVTKQGKDFYKLVLNDRTGEINATLWSDRFEFCDTNFSANQVVKINALVESYRNSIQLNIQTLTKTQDFDPKDFLPVSKTDPIELYDRCLNWIKKVKDEELKKLLLLIYKDENLKDKLINSPGAEKVHHAYLGGLLEHTLEMLEVALTYQNINQHLNQDLIIAGILLHDIGKVLELRPNGVTIERTVEGSLEGHLALGYGIVQKFYWPDFPSPLKIQLNHIILAHHGEIEQGSPVRPQTLEAFVVYLADFGSSHLNQFQRAVTRGLETSNLFSEYERWLGRTVYLEPYREISVDEENQAAVIKQPDLI